MHLNSHATRTFARLIARKRHQFGDCYVRWLLCKGHIQLWRHIRECTQTTIEPLSWSRSQITGCFSGTPVRIFSAAPDWHNCPEGQRSDRPGHLSSQRLCRGVFYADKCGWYCWEKCSVASLLQFCLSLTFNATACLLVFLFLVFFQVFFFLYCSSVFVTTPIAVSLTSLINHFLLITCIPASTVLFTFSSCHGCFSFTSSVLCTSTIYTHF